jgi:hypothetical protein
VKPIEPAQETPRRDRVGGQRPTLGGLTVAASVVAMTLVPFHHNPNESTPSPTAVIRADPPSSPPPGGTENPDQQPRHVCTHWDPEKNTTQDEPCGRPS